MFHAPLKSPAVVVCPERLELLRSVTFTQAVTVQHSMLNVISPLPASGVVHTTLSPVHTEGPPAPGTPFRLQIQAMASNSTGVRVKLLIKNPASHDSFSLEVSPDATLGELQRLLNENYEGNPLPQHQTVSERSRSVDVDVSRRVMFIVSPHPRKLHAADIRGQGPEGCCANH